GADGPAACGAGAGRQPGLVDELEGHVARKEGVAVEADPAATRKPGPVEVVEARVEDRAVRDDSSGGLERRHGERPQAGLARGDGFALDSDPGVGAVLRGEAVARVVDQARV